MTHNPRSPDLEPRRAASLCFVSFLRRLHPRAARQRSVFRAAGTALLLGVTLAYEPALGDGTIWTLPYTGTAAVTNGAVFSVTNTGAGGFGVFGASAGANGAGVTGVDQHGDGAGVSGTSGNLGVYGSGSTGLYGNGITNFGVYGTVGNAANTHPMPITDVAFAGVYGTGLGAGAIVGVWGNLSSPYPAVYGTNRSGSGIQGISGTQSQSQGTFGVYGVSYGSNSNGQFSAAGVYGFGGNTTTGVAGMSGSGGDPAVYGYNSSAGTGVWGQSAQGNGVYGITNRTDAAGVFGTNSNGGAAVIGLGNSTQSPTGYFRNDTGGGSGVGLQGQCNAGIGVSGFGGVGIYATTTVQNGNAGYFNGNIQVTGTVSGAAKHFKIDHPLDPAHKYLVHASVESSEMLNIYRGNVVLDSDGKATVQMPDWFQSENGDCSYNLTCVGGYAPVYVSKELERNQFEIAGGKPGLKVSWQVTGTRQDAYAQHHPLQVEQEKSGTEAGKYLNPEDFGKPREQGIGMQTAPNPRMTAVSRPPKPVLTSRLLHPATPPAPPKAPALPNPVQNRF